MGRNAKSNKCCNYYSKHLAYLAFPYELDAIY